MLMRQPLVQRGGCGTGEAVDDEEGAVGNEQRVDAGGIGRPAGGSWLGGSDSYIAIEFCPKERERHVSTPRQHRSPGQTADAAQIPSLTKAPP